MKIKLLFLIIFYSVSHAQVINSFMVVGDFHHRSPSPNFRESLLFEFTCSAIKEKVDFVFIAGDLILRDGTEESNYDSLLADWYFVLDTLDKHGIKLFACRGNNDVNSSVSWAKLFSGKYSLPDNGPEEEKYYTYSFTYDNFLFLSLDQYVNSRKVNQNWIDTQFMNNDKPFVFAASHEPAFKVFWNGLSSYPEDRNTFWTSLVNHNGKIYFSGHSHFYDHSELIDKDDSPGNNVHQIVVGTGGGGFHSDSVYNGNNGIWEPVRIFHEKSFGYLLVKVTEASISTIWKHRVDPFNFVEGGDNYSYIPTAVNFSKMTPNKYELFQNFPNPFNPITVISYSIPSSVKSETLPTGRQEANVASDFSLRNVTLKVYDILGREVVTLVNQNQKPGNYEIEFDGSHLSTGIYLYRLQINTSGFTDNIAVSKKMILLK